MGLSLLVCLFVSQPEQVNGASTIGAVPSYNKSGAASYAKKYAHPDGDNYTPVSGGKVISTSTYWYYNGTASNALAAIHKRATSAYGSGIKYCVYNFNSASGNK